MSIVSYACGNQYYYEYKDRNPDYVPQPSGCSGCSGVSGASGASGCSGASGASGTNGCSGASGSGTGVNTDEYIYTNIGSVEKLNVHQLIELFTKGDLEVSELDKWLSANSFAVRNLTKLTDNGMISYKFTYLNTDYTIACTEKAAKSQFDSLRQTNSTAEYLMKTYGFTQDEINEYYQISYSSYYDNKTTYTIKPNCVSGYRLKQHLQKLKEFETNYANNNLHYATGDDCINEYSDLLKADLKMKYGYSDNFIDNLLNNARYYAFTHINGGNLKQLVTLFKQCVDDLQKTPNLYREIGLVDGTMGNSWNIGMYQSWIYAYISSHEYSSNMSERLFANIFTNVFTDLNLSENERKSFVNVIFNEIAQKLDVERHENGDYIFTLSDLEKLDKNGKGSFLDEITTMVQNLAAKTIHMDDAMVNNATQINQWDFFNIIKVKGGTFGAEDLLNNLDKMLLSKDPGIRKFAQQLNAMFEDLRENSNDPWRYEDKLRACEYVIRLINDQCGATNGRPPRMHHMTLTKFCNNNSDMFEAMNNITTSTAFYNLYNANINGEIESFNQGSIGDCWFLSSILSLNSATLGQSLIKNSIKWNSDYTGLIVTFAGIDMEVEVSVEELLNADPNINGSNANYDGDGLSWGDNDVLLLEIAYKKIKGRINGSTTGDAHSANVQDAWDFVFDTSNARTSRSFWKMFIPNCSTDKNTCSGFDDVVGGVGGLLGIGDGVLDLDTGSVYDSLEKLWARKKAGQSFAATFSLLASDGHTYTCNTVDGGEPFKCTTHGHTIAITNITSNTITITDTDCKSYTVSWSDFANMGIARIEWVFWN